MFGKLSSWNFKIISLKFENHLTELKFENHSCPNSEKLPTGSWIKTMNQNKLEFLHKNTQAVEEVSIFDILGNFSDILTDVKILWHTLTRLSLHVSITIYLINQRFWRYILVNKGKFHLQFLRNRGIQVHHKLTYWGTHRIPKLRSHLQYTALFWTFFVLVRHCWQFRSNFTTFRCCVPRYDV